MTKYQLICDALKGWYQEWRFTAFITLTKPYGVKGWREIPPDIDTQIDRYREKIQKKHGARIGLIGVATLTYGGFLHVHLLALKENGEKFTAKEIASLKRGWPHNSDAREITRLETLAEYIASQSHLVNCKTFENLVSGGDILKETQQWQ